METQFKAISLSYRNAPVNVRELFSLNESSCKELLLKLREQFDLQEALVLSTCNRTEVYYTSEIDLSKQITAEITGTHYPEAFPLFVCLNTQQEAIQHLFEVSVGLESQVIGDLQISGQVKDAYQWSADLNMAGPFLHRLMHAIFFTNKRIVQETNFRNGAASVAYAAAEIAEDLTNRNREATILLVGLGEIGRDTAKNLSAQGFTNLSICNRTLEKAVAFAAELGSKTKVVTFEALRQAVTQADVVIGAVNVQQPIINKNTLAETEVLTHKFFIDLSVPRSIDSGLEEIPGVILYNIDDIQNKANEALNERQKAIPQVQAIVATAIEEFNDWTKEMLVSPVINRLKNALENIRLEEVNRYQKQLTEEQVKMVETITKNITQKIIKLPALQLKAACKRGEAETLIEVLNDLFNLEHNQVVH